MEYERVITMSNSSLVNCTVKVQTIVEPERIQSTGSLRIVWSVSFQRNLLGAALTVVTYRLLATMELVVTDVWFFAWMKQTEAGVLPAMRMISVL